MVFHDETRYGLRRLCIESRDKFPDLEMWLGMLPKDADAKIYRYVVKITREGVTSQFLWIYWKE